MVAQMQPANQATLKIHQAMTMPGWLPNGVRLRRRAIGQRPRDSRRQSTRMTMV